MNPSEPIEEKLEALGKNLPADDVLVETVMRRINALPGKQPKLTRQLEPIALVRRLLMNRLTKLAAAAVIIIAVVFSITILDKSIPSAYALEQTIQASHSVRYLHIINSFASKEEPMEIWLEFDPTGRLANMRLNKPSWLEPDDGKTVTIWKDNKAQVWLPKKNFLITLSDQQMANTMLKIVEELDPKFAVQRMQKAQEQGKMNLAVDNPVDKADPIIVTATSIKEDTNSPFQRVVLFVDQATKLVNTIELYKLEGSEYHKAMTCEYLDYNQPIDAAMFTFNNIPEDAMRMDQTAQEVGLAQGKLTNEEIAVEIVRQFLQALIEQDYAKAGKLFGGVPAERMKKAYGQIRFIRIITIDKPVPHALTGGLYVPCTVEIEENGQITQWRPEHSYVRQVHGQPGRWEIIGGFRGI